jgi:hypothetical protein
MIEVVAYTFNVLMFYLNQTSSESMFTDAQIYENMNRIVKMLGYNPVGYQTSLLPYTSTSIGLDPNTVYNIPRYSSINIGGTTYSFNKDVVFKGDNISDVTDDSILYQGKFYEYPLYTAEGDVYEVIYLTPGDNVIIDHFNIYVYVKGKSGVWREFDRVESLSLAGGGSEVFEARYNENGIYELKFGNNIYGRQLDKSDVVAVYYLNSDGAGNDVATGMLKPGVKYLRYASLQFDEIFNDVSNSVDIGTFAPPDSVTFENVVPSTPFSEPETVDELRENAPFAVKEKNTLSRTDDYDRYIKRTFSNVVKDVSTVDNREYTHSFLKYFYELGLTDTQSVSRILYNQVHFADSCNFNNLYAFVKPSIADIEDYTAFLSPSLKQMIINSINKLKLATSEVIICDPVYMALDIGINKYTDDVTLDDVSHTKLVLIKDRSSFRSNDAIITDVNSIFLSYFSWDETTFGMDVSFSSLNDAIMSVDGVIGFKTTRDDADVEYTGLSMISWNPVYEHDISLLLRNKKYDFFQVPYLNNRNTFINKLEVEVEG